MRFRTDRAELQKRFYALSRELHPDRFAGDLPELRVAALERMSLVNAAYQILQSPERTRAWILEFFAITAPKRLPADWVERWFEVQDLLGETDSASRAAVAQFVLDLNVEITRQQSRLGELEASADAQWAQQGEVAALTELQEIAAGESTLSYLLSLRRDVTRAGGSSSD